ncbi:Tyrosine recombinase XerC [bioreactor metagenome]|uniref:Tyrosine recombinase XerC n=1 Tax=bioreactor metagenome TaxID=1076179 RepID=A0A644VS82_9ZZZZ
MPRKGANIYKRKDGRWEGRLLKAEGNYQYLYAKSYKEVRQKMRDALEQKLSKSKNTKYAQKNAAGLFEAWLESGISARLKPSTYESYYHCLHCYVIPHFKLAENREISDVTIARFVTKLCCNTAISESYRKKILSIFKLSLRAIYKNVPESASLIACVSLPRVKEPKEISVFSLSEQRSIEYAIKGLTDTKALGMLICFYTGIRLGELCALKWNDIDFEAGTMSIVRTVSRIRNFGDGDHKTLLHVGIPKSQSSSRKIPLPAFLIKLANNRPSNENCYFLTENSEPFDPRIYQRYYKRLLARAGVRDRKFHTIRHTFATRALELGVDIKTLSELLGHSNVSITLNVYAHSLMEHKKAAIHKFDELHTTHMNVAVCAVNSAVTPSYIAY